MVIDHDIQGWSDEHREDLQEDYKEILQVGKNPDLPQEIADESIAEYCRQHSCDLITGDKRSYVGFLRTSIDRVLISRRDIWSNEGKPIFLVQLAE